MDLSKREHQIAELIAFGFTDKKIARMLFISIETAKTHRRNILSKIQGNNTADLTRWFIEKKVIECFRLNLIQN